LKSTGLANLLGLWETGDMKKPHLEVTKSDRPGLHGKCSSCDAYFTIVGPGLARPSAAMETLKAQFDKHFRKVHMREDASQAAARRQVNDTQQR
jgi:hypothetical protein